MLIILRIVIILIIAALCLCIGIGIASQPQSGFTHTYVVKSPSAVIWQALTDAGRMSEWMQDVRLINGPSQVQKDGVYRFYLHSYDLRAFHEEKVDIYKPETRIAFLRLANEKKPLLRDVLRVFELRALRNGTTEITVKISYRSDSFLTRIYDKIYLGKKIKNSTISDLRRLKRIIENV
jgi:uncharacterized membrane protein